MKRAALAFVMAATVCHARAARGGISFDGGITHAGTPVDGTVTVGFLLSSDEAGVVVLWMEEQQLNATDGYISALLGDAMANPLPDEVYLGPSVYLGLSVDGVMLSGHQELLPYP